MANRQTFGRRVAVLRQPPPAGVQSARAAQSASPAHDDIDSERPPPLIQPSDSPSIDEELREWKRGRKRGIAIPWRPLSFMATICFGVASFVLPDLINDFVQWPLYGLMAASFYVGVIARREKRQALKSDGTGATACPPCRYLSPPVIFMQVAKHAASCRRDGARTPLAGP